MKKPGIRGGVGEAGLFSMYLSERTPFGYNHVKLLLHGSRKRNIIALIQARVGGEETDELVNLSDP